MYCQSTDSTTGCDPPLWQQVRTQPARTGQVGRGAHWGSSATRLNYPAMSYTTAWEEWGVVWTFCGKVTGDEILQANREIYGDPRFDRLKYQIVDLTGVESFNVTEEDMAVIAANDRAAARSRPHVRIAVAAEDEIIKDLSAFYDAAMVGVPWHQQIFDSMREAREWVTAPRDGD